jgi:hypothetical protein
MWGYDTCAPHFPFSPSFPLRARVATPHGAAQNRPPCPANPKKAISSAASSLPKAANSTSSSSVSSRAPMKPARPTSSAKAMNCRSSARTCCACAPPVRRAPARREAGRRRGRGQRITNFEGKRRQMQFIGKLMRKLEPEALEAVKQALTSRTPARRRGCRPARGRALARPPGRRRRRPGRLDRDPSGHRLPAAARAGAPGPQGHEDRPGRRGAAPGQGLPGDLPAGARAAGGAWRRRPCGRGGGAGPRRGRVRFLPGLSPSPSCGRGLG